MSSCSLDLQIGTTGQEQKDLYKTIEITAQLQQDKINKLNAQFTALLGKTVIPFVVVEYQDVALENVEVFSFKENQYESNFLKVGGKAYQYANPKGKDTIKLIKNVEKEFQKISKLNNTANLKIQLYDTQAEDSLKKGWAILNHSKIKGNFQADPQLVNYLTEIIRRISNQFVNSPFMAFFELLEAVNVKLRYISQYQSLSPVEQFTEQLKQSYLSLLDFSKWVNKDKLQILHKAKGDIIIHITLPKLLSIRIKSEASVLSSFLSIFI